MGHIKCIYIGVGRLRYRQLSLLLVFFSRLFSLPFLFGPNEIDKTQRQRQQPKWCVHFSSSSSLSLATFFYMCYSLVEQSTIHGFSFWHGGWLGVFPFCVDYFSLRLYAPKKGSCGFDSVQSNDLRERRPCIPPLLLCVCCPQLLAVPS